MGERRHTRNGYGLFRQLRPRKIILDTGYSPSYRASDLCDRLDVNATPKWVVADKTDARKRYRSILNIPFLMLHKTMTVTCHIVHANKNKKTMRDGPRSTRKTPMDGAILYPSQRDLRRKTNCLSHAERSGECAKSPMPSKCAYIRHTSCQNGYNFVLLIRKLAFPYLFEKWVHHVDLEASHSTTITM
jgi:hypothetical protein